MSATGIGAAVRRKEDQRFITGRGHYTDDVNRPGQSYAYFLRSPHAHAKIKAIDSKAAAGMPGVLAVLTGAELAADKVGGLICGWMIKSKDGSPMKTAPHPAIAHGKANYVGDAVAVIIAETLAQAKDAAEKIKVDYELLPPVADPAKAQSGPQIHEVAPRNTIYQWHLGDPKAVEAAFKCGQARHQARPHQQPPGAERDRAARRDRRIRRRHRRSHPLEHDAEPARRASRHFRVRRHCARAQAARDRARRRRRLRLEDFHLSGRGRLPVGVAQDRPPGEMGVGSLGGLPQPMPTAATTSPMPRWRSTPTARSRGSRSRPSPILAPTCRRSPRRCRPISTAPCCPANMRSRRSIARWTPSTPTPCRSMPIAAPAVRRRPSWSNA